MKAAYLYGPRDVRVEDAPDVDPGPDDLLLDVTAVGICGSDLHTYLNGEIGGTVASQPFILGHEAAGIVSEVGANLEGIFHLGQHVAIDPAIPCEVCERCQEGNPNLCTNLGFIGLYPQPGALREQMVHPGRVCVPLPEGITPVSAALLEPLGVALHAIRLAKIDIGDDVLVIGSGAIGLLLIRLARLAGARHIFVSDEHAWRLQMAANFGATTLIDATREDVVDVVQRATNGRGVDIAIESAWVTETANQCVEAVRNGGRVIIAGIPVEDMIKFRATVARRKGLSIKMSRRMKHTYPAAIALASSGQVALEELATHRYPLAQTNDALRTAADYADGVIRAMVMPTTEF